MNCFQICIFVLIATTHINYSLSRIKLWIAFKFVSLYWSQQLPTPRATLSPRCELLSNLYLCTDRNNALNHIEALLSLWIAFKFVSLYWSQQHFLLVLANQHRCELLSNLYLCTDRNNLTQRGNIRSRVVNCFQICIFVLIATTSVYALHNLVQLWIAFKFVSLYWSQQHVRLAKVQGVRCELLSNLYLCTDRNN